MDEKLVYSAKEAASVLGVNYITIYRLAKQEGFPAVRVGRRVLIPRRGLEQWLERESQKAVGE